MRMTVKEREWDVKRERRRFDAKAQHEKSNTREWTIKR